MKKKNRFLSTPVLLVIFVLLLLNSCTVSKPVQNTVVMTNRTVVPTSGSVTDIDGNVYHIVNIGSQVWIAENLKTTKYNDGTPIPNITANSAWAILTTPGYCFYENDANINRATYGAIYNWYAVNTNKLCPMGWRVPTDVEWTILTNFLGGENAAGGKLKESGISHWITPNDGGNNISGFTALPAGYRQDDGSFYNINDDDYWWSSTVSTPANSWGRNVNYNYAYVTRDSYNKKMGYSVRCIREH